MLKFNGFSFCRFLVIPLCFLLFFCLILNPVQVKAYTPAYCAIQAFSAVIFGSDFIADSADALGTILNDMYDSVPHPIAERIASLANEKMMTLDEDTYLWIQAYIFDHDFARNHLKHKKVDLTDSTLKQQDIPLVQVGTELYLPTEIDVESLMQLNSFQILYQGFVDQQVSAIEESNKILDTIRRFLGTAELSLSESLDLLSYQMNITYDLTRQMSLSLQTGQGMIISNIQSMSLSLQKDLGMINDNVKSMSLALQDDLGIVYENIRKMSLSLQELSGNLISEVQSLGLSLRQTLRDEFLALRQDLDVFLDVLLPYVENMKVLYQPNLQLQENQLLLQQWESSLNDTSKKGKDKVIFYIGQARDLIGDYRDAFLAMASVLASFLALPIIGDLVSFGLALGIFALVVNLGSSIASKAGYDSNKKSKSASKGG